MTDFGNIYRDASKRSGSPEQKKPQPVPEQEKMHSTSEQTKIQSLHQKQQNTDKVIKNLKSDLELLSDFTMVLGETIIDSQENSKQDKMLLEFLKLDVCKRFAENPNFCATHPDNFYCKIDCSGLHKVFDSAYE